MQSARADDQCSPPAHLHCLLAPCRVRRGPVQPDRQRVTSPRIPAGVHRISRAEDHTIQAVDQNTGNLVTRGTAISATSGFPTQTLGGTNYSIYPWSFDAGVLPANFWSPQSIVADLATSQGHLELFASADGNDFYTFSPAAWNSVVLPAKIR